MYDPTSGGDFCRQQGQRVVCVPRWRASSIFFFDGG